MLLTKQKEIIEQREKEKELLTREMHHRVKNNLQLTSSLLNLQARQIEDNQGKQALKEARNRIQTISLIHQKLYVFENISTINLAEYIPELCNAIFQSNCDSAKQITLNHEIDSIFVSLDTAISIGLFVNEALLNSIKHGFSIKSFGTISIFIKEYKNNIELLISDNGKGITNLHSIDEFGNFGFQLLRSFATKLNSTIGINTDNGTTITLNLPLKIKVNG